MNASTASGWVPWRWAFSIPARGRSAPPATFWIGVGKCPGCTRLDRDVVHAFSVQCRAFEPDISKPIANSSPGRSTGSNVLACAGGRPFRGPRARQPLPPPRKSRLHSRGAPVLPPSGLVRSIGTCVHSKLVLCRAWGILLDSASRSSREARRSSIPVGRLAGKR